MGVCILFREDQSTRDEKKEAELHFPVATSRLDCDGFDLVIPRYSVLPFYRELESDLKRLGTKLINTYSEHQYVANFDYYHDIEQYTPKTWFRPVDVPKDSGPWILKGRTNSRKFQWNEKMYAETWEDLMEVHRELSNDALIGDQGVIIRKFEKLKVVSESIAGPPFTNEWRFFYYKGQLLSFGYYWSSSEVEGVIDSQGLGLAQKVADIVKESVPFVVIDVAQKLDGSWIVIELNDGQMSGLSNNDPKALYSNLKEILCPGEEPDEENTASWLL
jgi:hypothetical protein